MKDASITEPPRVSGHTGLRPPSGISGEVDLREALAVLWRRRGTVAGVTVLITLLAAVIVFQITPLYRAETQIMIEARQNRVVDVEEVLSGLSSERETIESERRVIASRALAEKVIAALELNRDPEFNPALRETDRLRALLRTEAPKTPEQALETERARTVDTFLDRLDVTPEGRSRVITIAFASERPGMAARIANTVAELYLLQQREAKFEATRRATEWLYERTADLRETVKASEDAVEAFRREAGLIEGKGFTLASQQVSELNTQLILARTTRAEAEARLHQVRALLAGEGGIDSAAEVIASPLIQRLKEQEAEVMRRAAELATQYGPKHPRMINVQAELEDIEAKIGAEVQKIVQSLRNEAAVARAREASLNASLGALERNVGRANSDEVRLRALEREASANRRLFETFLSRLKETTAQEDLHLPDARIISRADIPDTPAFPRTKLMLAGAMFSALIAGIAAAFLLERLDPGFRSSDQIERQLGVAGLGLIPLMSGGRSDDRTPQSYVLQRPASAFAESLRTLHTALLLSNVDRPPRSVLVTSSVPQEGKSTVALSLARLMAKSGRKVLLIDADLRRPRIAEVLRIPERPGLVDVLARSVSWLEAVQHDAAAGLDVLTTGESAVSPPDLFGSAQMRVLMAELAAYYDLVVVDSPPVLAVSEPRILACLVDTTVFVIRWAKTPREVAGLGLKQIRESGGSLAGAVLSMVNVREHARYGYGDSGRYYGPACRYYTD